MNDNSTYEAAIVWTIHLVIPLIGLAFYIYVIDKMRREEVPNPPEAELFFTFFIYGGLLLLLLTSLFWYWSAMASLGTLFICLIAPLIMIGIAVKLGKQRSISTYHRVTFSLAIFYIPILVVSIVFMFMID